MKFGGYMLNRDSKYGMFEGLEDGEVFHLDNVYVLVRDKYRSSPRPNINVDVEFGWGCDPAERTPAAYLEDLVDLLNKVELVFPWILRGLVDFDLEFVHATDDSPNQINTVLTGALRDLQQADNIAAALPGL